MTPSFSVVIPTHRRPERLGHCLAALARLEYPRSRLEVVVVEDGGPTEELAGIREQDFDGLRVRWLDQPHAGPAIARNLGAREASGEFLAFTDDDCRPRPDWLDALAARLVEAPNAVVGGHTVNALENNAFSEASQALVSFITDYGQRCANPFFASNNFALSRALFLASGGFDETFPLAGGEDRELCHRLVQRGTELSHVPAAVVDHFHALGPLAFWRQHFRYGRGAYQFHLVRAAAQDSSPFRDLAAMTWNVSLRFYVDLIRFPFAARTRRRLVTSCLLAVSQVSNIAGFFTERIFGSRRPVRPAPEVGR